MTDSKHKRGLCRALAALTAVLCLGLWVWGARAKDCFSLQKSAAYQEGCDPADGSVPMSGTLVSQSEWHDLYPGAYTLTVQYQTQAVGGCVEVFDPGSQCVLARAEYTPGGDTLRLPVTVSDYLPVLWVNSIAGDGALFLETYTLASDGPVYTDAWWLPALALAAAGSCAWCLRRRQRGHEQDIWLWLLAGAFSLPFLTDHLPCGMDIEFHLSRIAGLGAALRAGQFPVRLNADLLPGGYISPIMYPELFLYPSGAMTALGTSVLLAMKVLLVFITFATAFTAYYAMRQMLGGRAAMLFTLLYMCCPYRFNDIYTRGALGEALAMAFLPLAAVGIWQLVQGDFRKGFWSALLGISAVLQSHIITAFLVLLFGTVYGLAALVWQGKRFWQNGRPAALGGAAAATVLLNAWFLVPFLHFSRWDLNIFHDASFMRAASIYPWQAFMESYATKGENYTTQTAGEMPFSLGFALLVCLLLCAGRLPGGKNRGDGLQKGLLAMGTLALWMTTTLFPWNRLETLPLMQMTFCKIQFPWRMLAVAAVMYCAAAALELERLWQENHTPIVAGVTVLALLAALNGGSRYLFTNNTTLADSSADYTHEWLYEGQYLQTGHRWDAIGYQTKAGSIQTGSPAEITGFQRQGDSITFSYHRDDTQQPAVFRMPFYNYGLYRATAADGSVLPIRSDERYGLVEVLVTDTLPEGTVTAAYRAPLRFRLGEAVTLLTAAVLLWLRRRQIQARKKAPSGKTA